MPHRFPPLAPPETTRCLPRVAITTLPVQEFAVMLLALALLVHAG